MSRKKKHNQEVRARVIAAAGMEFRRHGYDGVGINALMEAAGLTRGAFYAHFQSKESLFAAVMESEHPLLRKLQARTGQGEEALWSGLKRVMGYYLDFNNRQEIWAACSLATLHRDVARAGPTTKAAYEAVLNAIEIEVIRGLNIRPGHPSVTSAVTLAIGAVAQAQANLSTDRQRAILTAAEEMFFHMMDAARMEKNSP